MLAGSASDEIERDGPFEREVTRSIASGFVKPDAIIRLAERRSDRERSYSSGGSRLRVTGRDFVLDALEELADARNYIVWELQCIHLGLAEDDGRVEHLQNALRHTILDFEELRMAWRP